MQIMQQKKIILKTIQVIKYDRKLIGILKCIKLKSLNSFKNIFTIFLKLKTK